MRIKPTLIITTLIIFTSLMQSQAQSAKTYRVQSGDQLSKIARAFDITLEQIVGLNNIKNANDIVIGQRLIVGLEDVIIVGDAVVNPLPSNKKAFNAEHTSIASEFMAHLEQENLLSRTIATASTESQTFTGALWPSQYPAPITNMAFSPPEARQGQSFGLAIQLAQYAELKARFVGQEFLFFVDDAFSQNAILAVPVGQEPGIYPLDIEITVDEVTQNLTLPIIVSASAFETEKIDVPPASTSLLGPDTSRLEAERVTKLCSQFEAARHWDSAFRYPTDTSVTLSEFGSTRTYDGSPHISFHDGLDLKANSNTPVYATANGVVRLAEELVIRGNTVVIDHGMGLCTVYSHLSKLLVSEGDTVTKDQAIANAGSTGFIAGTHLHWEMRVMGISINPQQWTTEMASASQ